MIKAATIPNGTALSDSIALEDREVVGVQFPASWTNAGISFQVSADGGATFKKLFNGGTELTLGGAADADRWCGLTANEFTTLRGWTHLKIVSGTSAAAVNQGAQRVVNIAFRERG